MSNLPTILEQDQLCDSLISISNQLNRLTELLTALDEKGYYVARDNPARLAWLIDSVEMILGPNRKLIERASALHEIGELDPTSLEAVETNLIHARSQRHHAMAAVAEVKKMLGQYPTLEKCVEKFRYDSGKRL